MRHDAVFWLKNILGIVSFAIRSIDGRGRGFAGDRGGDGIEAGGEAGKTVVAKAGHEVGGDTNDRLERRQAWGQGPVSPRFPVIGVLRGKPVAAHCYRCL